MGLDKLPESRADMLKLMDSVQPSKMEYNLFSSGFALNAAETKELMQSPYKDQRELVIARAIDRQIRELQASAGALDSLR